MMLYPTAGLTDDLVKTTIYKLEVVYKRRRLARIFSSVLESLESVLSLVLKEVFSIRADVIYWENLNKSNSWEIRLFQWNSRIYNTVLLRSPHSSIMVDPKNIHNSLLNTIDVLQQKLSLLLIVLAKLHEITGSHLKEIVLLLLKSEQFLSVPPQSAATEGEEENVHIDGDDILSLVFVKLQLAMDSLVNIVAEHLAPLDKVIQEAQLGDKAMYYIESDEDDGEDEGEGDMEVMGDDMDEKVDGLYAYCVKIQDGLVTYQSAHANEVKKKETTTFTNVICKSNSNSILYM